tara:strand:+ start:5358 stop:6737 length:1380 start_codon:yes stop_codon:yes gene_type:complete
MKKRLFPLLIALSALAVSGSAAFYSVFGLSKLFAGAASQVIIMAGSLEFAKLVVASLLYQYWGTINKFLRTYFMIACFVLMVITSGGIYGFLSGAYQSTATQSELLDKSLMILEQKQIRFEESKSDLTIEKTQINQSISDLRTSLSNPHSVSWYDKNSETVITSSSSSARRALQAELKTAIFDRDNLNIKLEAVLDSIGKTDMALLNKEISNEDQRELGPLKYLASTTGWPMDKVVNYFLLLIVFVFDPLAIALVVAANMAFAQIRKPEDPEEDYFVARNKHIEEITLDGGEIEVTVEPTEAQIKDIEDNTTEPSQLLKQRVKENQDKLKEEEIDDKYFSDLKDYIEFSKEEPVEDITYPKFVDKHYPKPTVEKELYLETQKDIDLKDIENYLTNVEYVKKEEKKYKLKSEKELMSELEDTDLERLTDTTKTLIVEDNDDPKKERVLRYDKTGKGRKKT